MAAQLTELGVSSISVQRQKKGTLTMESQHFEAATFARRGGRFAPTLTELKTELKAYLAAALPLDAPVGVAVLLLPYDLREMAMLGDAGSNALGALLGLNSVKRFTGKGQWVAIGALAGLTILGERKSIGAWIERAPVLSWIDRLGRA